MTINPAAVSSTDKPARKQNVLLGGFTALAQSAWMGFALAADVLEQIRLSPAGIARRAQVILPSLPRRFSLRGLLTREFSIAEASFILMASFFLSAGLGAVRQVLFNSRFGVSMEANAYYAAFRLPDTLFSLIAGGALSSAMIPVLLNVRRQEGEAAGWRLVSVILSSLLAVFGALIVIVEIFTPALVNNLLAPGFDEPTSALTVSLTRIMLLQPLILLIGSAATAVLNSRNRFLLTGLSVVSHNVMLILSILAIRFFPGLGIYGPTFGVFGGAVLQALILMPGLREQGGGIRFAFDPTDPHLREVVRLLVPNGLSVGVNYSGFIVDTAYATQTTQAAALAAIYNAFLLVGLPIALLGQAVGQAAFPRLAAHAETGNREAMIRTLLRSLGAAIGLAVPAAAALYLLGRPVIRLLFERGEFTPQAGDLTYQVLVVYAIGLPFYVATEVVTRGLIALRDTRTPLLTNTGQLILRVILLSLLVVRYGAVAIPAAFALSAAIETTVLSMVLFLKLRSPAINDRQPLVSE